MMAKKIFCFRCCKIFEDSNGYYRPGHSCSILWKDFLNKELDR
jgi:hypothetical protein